MDQNHYVFNYIISFMTLYDVMNITTVCKKWKKLIVENETYWRQAFVESLLLDPLKIGGVITLKVFKEEFTKIYSEGWQFRLHKFILDKKFGYKVSGDEYMAIYSQLFDLANIYHPTHGPIIMSKKMKGMLGTTTDQKILKSFNIVTRYLKRIGIETIDNLMAESIVLN